MKKNPLNLNPQEELRQMRLMIDRRFGPPGEPEPCPCDEPIPIPVDATERDGIITIKAAIPGIACDKIEVLLNTRTLTIRSHPDCTQGHFSRTVSLPSDLAIARARTGVRNGFVYVKIPKCTSRHASA